LRLSPETPVRENLLAIWEKLRANFWFVPSLMALSTVGFSFLIIRIDANLGEDDLVGWLWSGGAGGARSLLSTLASSMITLAGTVFSITIAALTLAGSQFGWRLLRNFTRDFGNQIVLGTFVSTFLYCLLILRTIRGEDEGAFVPKISVTCAVAFAVASVGVLIYFIDHMARSIQAENLIAAIGKDLKDTIAELSVRSDERPVDDSLPLDREPFSIRARQSGYLEHLSRAQLVEFAERKALLIESCVRPGDFVLRGSEVLKVHGTQTLNEREKERLHDAIALELQRTPTQDVRFGVRQLTEIVARALSPGINDPYTAMTCADWLGDALAELASKPRPPLCRLGPGGEPRLVEQTVRFPEIAALSFDPFRVYGAESEIVMIHVLNVFAGLGLCVQDEEYRAALRQLAEEAAQAALSVSRGQGVRTRLEAAATRARSALAV
jgi:uncharacterized membrane protein